MAREMEALVEKLEKRMDLIAKRLGGLYKTPEDFKKEWEIIAQELHTMGFLRNSNGSDIKKKWADLKFRTKKKVTEIEKQRIAGEKGPSTVFLTGLDQRVIVLMKKICLKKGAGSAKSHNLPSVKKTIPSSSCVISPDGLIDESQQSQERPLCTSWVKQEVLEECPGMVAAQSQVYPALFPTEAAQGYSTDIEASQSHSPTLHSECTDDQEYIIPDLDMDDTREQENSAEPGISCGIDASERTNTPWYHFQRRQCLEKDEFNDFLDLKREKLKIMKQMLEVTKLTALEMQKLNKNYAETKSELKELNSTLKEIFRLKP